MTWRQHAEHWRPRVYAFDRERLEAKRARRRVILVWALWWVSGLLLGIALGLLL